MQRERETEREWGGGGVDSGERVRCGSLVNWVFSKVRDTRFTTVIESLSHLFRIPYRPQLTPCSRILLEKLIIAQLVKISDRLCGLVVRVLGYRSRVRFPALPEKKSRSGTGSTQPREYN
jgi:hypothetical protein